LYYLQKRWVAEPMVTELVEVTCYENAI